MGWFSFFRRFEAEQPLPPQHILMQEPGAVYGSVENNINGSWKKKLAVITPVGYLCIYATDMSGYIYNLRDIDSYKVKAFAGGETELKFKTSDSKKCALKLDRFNAKILVHPIMNFEEPILPSEDFVGRQAVQVQRVSDVNLNQENADVTDRSKLDSFPTETSLPDCDSCSSIPSYTGSQFTHSTISVMGNNDLDPIEKLADLVL